jgi:hypothetical protein
MAAFAKRWRRESRSAGLHGSAIRPYVATWSFPMAASHGRCAACVATLYPTYHPNRLCEAKQVDLARPGTNRGSGAGGLTFPQFAHRSSGCCP